MEEMSPVVSGNLSPSPPRLVSWDGFFVIGKRQPYGSLSRSNRTCPIKASGLPMIFRTDISHRTTRACILFLTRILLPNAILSASSVGEQLPDRPDSPCPIKVEVLPSARLFVLAVNGSTTSSDSLPAECDFGSALYAPLYPFRPPGRVSPVPLFAVRTPRPLYPGGVLREFFPEARPPFSGSAVSCLRRDMLGSASHNPFGRIL